MTSAVRNRDNSVENAVSDAVMADLYKPESAHDLHRHYARLREFGPVAATSDGRLIVTGYRLGNALLRDSRLVKDSGGLLVTAGQPDWKQRPGLRMMYTSMLMSDGAPHTRLRRLVSGAFGPGRIGALRARIERMVRDLVDALPDAGDFMSGLAFPLPIAVIGDLIGIPPADNQMFQGLVREWLYVLEGRYDDATLDRTDAAATTIHDYLVDLIAERRTAPRDDLVSMLAAPSGDDRLSTEEIIIMAAALVGAGSETTMGLLGGSLAELLTHQGQLALWPGKPELTRLALDELARYVTPIQMLSAGVFKETVTLADQVLPANHQILLLLGATNRDPEMFTEPERLKLDRAETPTLAYGAGAHYCLGASLARMELEIAMPAVFRAFPKLRLTGPPTFRSGFPMRFYQTVPISTN